MQDFGTKTDNSPPPGGQLSAVEFNNLATENENAVLRSGQALNGGLDTQLAQSLFLHGVKAQSFQDSGVANAYVATPVSGASGVLVPAAYTNMAGAVISFKAAASNSAASTLNFGQTTGTLLGTKAIRTQEDTALLAGQIVAGQQVELVYSPTFDSGNGAWVLMPWATPKTSVVPSSLNVRMSVTAASATGTLTADSITTNVTIGGKSYQIPSFSKVINLASVGAGGMDIGTAPVSGFVGIYAIYNPASGVSALLAVNATAGAVAEVYNGANMPVGFTASALLSVWPTNASSQLVVGALIDRTLCVITAIQLTVTTAVASPTAATMGGIPFNAKRFGGFLDILGSNVNAGIQFAVTPTVTTVGVKALYGTVQVASGLITAPFDVAVVTPRTIYYTATVTAGAIQYRVQMSEYTI